MGASHLELVRHALATARAQGLAEVELAEGDDFHFSAVLAPRKKQAITNQAGDSEPETPLVDILSPLVGYFRPDSKVLQIGQRVEAGQVVASIFALGLLTDVVAQSAGEVVEVLAAPEDAVQFGQPIARIRP
ncbi:MAG: acetyl-CoA carboxylase biotin carboxyl carrier protein [Fimbriimonas sp.]